MCFASMRVFRPYGDRCWPCQLPQGPTRVGRKGCKLAFEAHPGPVRRRAGNNLTAARKFKGENVFKFHGMLMICANGLWRSDEEWPFQVEFVDQPRGPNQSKNIKSYFPEFWFLMRVLWLSAKRAWRSDRIEPRRSRTIGVVQDLLNFGRSPADVPDSKPGIFVRDCLVQYHPSEQKPSKCGKIEEALAIRLQVEPTKGAAGPPSTSTSCAIDSVASATFSCWRLGAQCCQATG